MVVSSAYLRLWVFLLAILIPACASSSPAFLMMYSAYKLNKQGDKHTALMCSFPDLEPVCCSMSSSNCCFLTCIQVPQEAGEVVWHSNLFKNFPQFVVITTVKDPGTVIKTDILLESSCFFWWCWIWSMLAIWSLVLLPFLNPVWTSDVLLKPSLENFEHYFASTWDECNFVVVWAFFDTAFLWDWNENWLFQSCGHCWVF